MVKRLTHRILTPTFMGSIPIAPVHVKYFAFVGSNPTRAVISWQTKIVKSNRYNKCVDWDKTEIKLGILSKWNISDCVYGLIVNVLEVVHSKTKTTNTNKKGKKKYGKN